MAGGWNCCWSGRCSRRVEACLSRLAAQLRQRMDDALEAVVRVAALQPGLALAIGERQQLGQPVADPGRIVEMPAVRQRVGAARIAVDDPVDVGDLAGGTAAIAEAFFAAAAATAEPGVMIMVLSNSSGSESELWVSAKRSW